MQLNSLFDLKAYRVHHAQRSHRLLKDHRYLTTANLPDLFSPGRQGSEVHDLLYSVRLAFTMEPAMQKHLPGHDLARPADDLQDGESAVIVPPGDRQAMTAALRNLDSDRARARRIGQAGLASFEKNFASEVNAQRWLDYVTEVVGSAR